MRRNKLKEDEMWERLGMRKVAKRRLHRGPDMTEDE